MREGSANGSSDVGRSRRRSYVAGIAGAVGLATIGYSLTEGTRAREKYDLVEVDPGEKYVVDVGDGETYGNEVIDITAEGATFHIDAVGRNWVVHDVGIRGTWDVQSDGHVQAITAEVGRNGYGVVDNFYFADGVLDDDYPGVTGIYVRRTHSGHLRINGVNIQDVPNNAIYASTPGYPEGNAKGYPPGGSGTVDVENSFAAECKASHFRVGTTGSSIRNCVAVGGDRGVWARFGENSLLGSDLTGASVRKADGDVVCGSNNWPSSKDAILRVEDTVYGSEGNDIQYPGTILGSTADREPRTEPQPGVPTTAEEAAACQDRR
jgi:hypothetical protein